MPKSPKIQKTPKGYEIPIPTRKEVYEALEKVAKGSKAAAAEEEASGSPSEIASEGVGGS